MDRIHVMELVRAFQIGDMSRRQFLKRAGVAGVGMVSANALLAACAEFPNNNPPPVVDQSQPAAEPGLAEDGALTVGVVEYPDTDGETLMGYMARQSDIPAAPAVIIIQEWWGLNDHIKDVARRYAAEGFVALAPDLYHGQVATEPDEARKLAMELDTPEAVKEIEQAMTYLLTQDYVNSDKVGVVGYCMGGALVLQTALSAEDMAAGVVYYGSPLEPDQAKTVKAPILSFIGTEDRIPAEAVAQMHAAFTEAGIKNDYEVYEGAQHAFFNETRPESYNAEASTDSWPKALAWLRDGASGV
jgi:carboxymethylenebutenolidase